MSRCSTFSPDFCLSLVFLTFRCFLSVSLRRIYEYLWCFSVCYWADIAVFIAVALLFNHEDSEGRIRTESHEIAIFLCHHSYIYIQNYAFSIYWLCTPWQILRWVFLFMFFGRKKLWLLAPSSLNRGDILLYPRVALHEPRLFCSLCECVNHCSCTYM